ncbi:YhgE/Pip family protein [Bacillus chungangensis]|uniref:YhgE/Pip-like protein n=1 Tax=Bacillus chungangensis TaxID=587633 RepID=A0ABT9WNI1_9BACI|nr:YhgE/Pip family protein [Bacillus chungangensis]MDQ0174821.1 YhgE/Pip-like protein [Bacillus chungangensis]
MGFQELKQELIAIPKNKLFIPIMVAILMPIMYCGTFLWAFWDPYERMGQLPAAVVNFDKGTDFQGESLKIGDDIVNNLKNNENFNWEFVSEKAGKAGLKDGKYFFMIVIPEDFSEKVASVFDKTPVKSKILFVPNEGLNYLVGMVGENAIGKIESNISKSITESYTKAVFENIHMLSENIKKLSEGAEKNAEGTSLVNAQLIQVIESNPNVTQEQKSQLVSALHSLANGSNELVKSLKIGGDALEKYPNNDETYRMFADPINIEKDKFAAVPNYGSGFVPFSLSLGLFIGAMIVAIVFPVRDPAKRPSSAFGWFFSKSAILVIVAVFQALITGLVLLMGLKLEVESVPSFIFFSIFTSIVFITLVQLFVTLLGNAGRFLIILLLILQITSSGGTFPAQLVPDALQVVSPFLPMTHSVAGFRAVVTNSDYPFMWDAVKMLSVFLVLAIIGSLLYFIIQYKRVYKEHKISENHHY